MGLFDFLGKLFNYDEEEKYETEEGFVDTWQRTYTPSGRTPAPPIGQKSPLLSPEETDGTTTTYVKSQPKRYAPQGPSVSLSDHVRSLQAEADQRTTLPGPSYTPTNRSPVDISPPTIQNTTPYDRTVQSAPSFYKQPEEEKQPTLPSFAPPMSQDYVVGPKNSALAANPIPAFGAALGAGLESGRFLSGLAGDWAASLGTVPDVQDAVGQTLSEWGEGLGNWLEREPETAIGERFQGFGSLFGALIGGDAEGVRQGLLQAMGSPGRYIEQTGELARGIFTDEEVTPDLTTPEGQVLSRMGEEMQSTSPLRRTAETLLTVANPIVMGAYNLFKASSYADYGAQAVSTFETPLGDTTLGQAYSTGVRALDILSNQMVLRGEGSTLQAQDRDGQWYAVDRPLDAVLHALSPKNITAALVTANQQLVQALTPTEDQMRWNTPVDLAEATASAIAMGHHGIATMGNQFDDWLGVPQAASAELQAATALMQQAATLPYNSDERAELELQAAQHNSRYNELVAMTPLKWYRQNENLWMAVPFEVVADPFNYVSGFFKLVGLTPKARRMAQGWDLAKLNSAEASQLIQQGKDAGRPLWDHVRQALGKVPGLAATLRSQAAYEGRSLYHGLNLLLGTFETQEDMRLVLSTFLKDYKTLEQGIPTRLFTSPKAVMQDVGGVIPFPQSPLVDYRVTDALRGLFDGTPEEVIEKLVAAIPSIAGQGPVNKVQFGAELLRFLTRIEADKLGVSFARTVPLGTVSVDLQSRGGQTVLRYLGEGKKLLMESDPMGVTEAQALAEQARKVIGGQEFRSNVARDIASLKTRFLSQLTITNPLNFRSFLANAIGNRGLGLWDGGWGGFSNVEERIDWATRMFGGMIPDDDIARYIGAIQDEGFSTMVSREMGRLGNFIPGSGWMRRLRNTDENRVKAAIITNVMKEFVEDGTEGMLRPALKGLLQSIGVRNQEEMELIANSLADAFIGDGPQKALELFYVYANGRGRVTASALAPNLRDYVPHQLMQQLDDIVGNVNSTTIQQAMADINNISGQVYTDLSNHLHEYGVPVPSHTFWTRAEMQRQVADLAQNVNLLNQKIPGLKLNVEQELANLKLVQDNIAQSMESLFRMSAGNQRTVGYIYEMWERIDHINTVTRARVARHARAVQAGLSGLDAAAKSARWNRHYTFQASETNRANAAIQRLIENTRDFLASGQWQTPGTMTPDGLTGITDLPSLLGKMGIDETEVFRYLQQNPKSTRFGPKRQLSMEAGERGLDKFIAQINLALQNNWSVDNMDEYLSTFGDVRTYYIQYVTPELKKARPKIAAAEAALEAELKNPTPDPKKVATLKAERGVAYQEYYDHYNQVLRDYYAYAYGRYQAGAMLILGNGQQMPVFDATSVLGRAFTGGNPVKIVSFDWANKGQVWVQNTRGKVLPIVRSKLPQPVLDQLKDLGENGHTRIADSLGRLAGSLFADGTGFDEVDDLIKGARTGGYEPIYDTVRMNVASYFGNPQPRPPMPHTVEAASLRQIQNIFGQLISALPSAARINERKFNAMPTAALNRFNQEIMPMMQNILYGSLRAGKEMAGLSTVDFIHEYPIDILLSLRTPYLFWATRQGKNIMERMLFNPMMVSQITRAMSVVEDQAIRQGMPESEQDSIAVGRMLEGWSGKDLGRFGDVRIDIPIDQWMPAGWEMLLNGWNDMRSLNNSYDYIAEVMAESEFGGKKDPALVDWLLAGAPGGAEGWLNAANLVDQTLSGLGFGSYPQDKALLLWATGKGDEVSLSQFGLPGQLVGWGTMALTGQGNIGPVNAAPYYWPYIANTPAAAAQGRGDLDATHGRAIQAALQAMYQGREVDPWVTALFPNIMQEAEQWTRIEGGRRLLLSLASYLTPFSWSAPEEQTILNQQAYDEYKAMAYDPVTMPFGGKQRSLLVDPQSPYFSPGAYARQGQGQITAEDKDYDPTNGIQPPDMGQDMAYYQGYLPQRQAIYDAVDPAIEAVRQKYTPLTRDNYKQAEAEIQAIYDQRDAQLAALANAMPREAARSENAEPSKMYGWNPTQAQVAVAGQLHDQAEADNQSLNPGPYPENGSRDEKARWSEQNDEYKQAVEATYQRYLQDPQMVGQAFGDYPFPPGGVSGASSQPATGEPAQPPAAPALPGAAPAQQSATGTPVPPIGTSPFATPQPREAQTMVGQPVTPDPQNPYFDRMAEAEQQYGLPPGILQELARNESSFDPNAVGGNGVGLMQFEPSAWQDMNPGVPLSQRTDPDLSIDSAARYLVWIYDQLPEDKKSWGWALTAYNWGIGQVLAADDLSDAPPKTQAYVNRILGGTTSGTPTESTWVDPVPGYKMGQTFGNNPEYYGQFNLPGHDGVDYPAPIGTPVVAAVPGKVVVAGSNVPGWTNYGTMVGVQAADGSIYYYAHLSGMDVKVGDVLSAGDPIGKVGDTGNTQGAHLHLARYNPNDTTGSWRGFSDPTSGVPTQQQGGNVAWTIDTGADPYGESAYDRFKQDKDAMWEEVNQARVATYPQYESAYQEYQSLSDAEREAYREQHPEIRAVTLYQNNEEGWRHIETTWGEGAALVYARIPKSEYYGGEPGARDAYYQANPDAFLMKAWLEGRPAPIDDTAGDDDQQTSWWDNGKDYALAEEKFGSDIWSVVRQAQQLAAYDPNNPETGRAWGAFHEQYPQYKQWSEWWYGLLPQDDYGNDQRSGYRFGKGYYSGYSPYSRYRSQYRPYYSRYYGGGWRSFGSGSYEQETSGRINPYSGALRSQRTPLADLPAWQGTGAESQSGWRRWLGEGEQYLREWRGR